MNMENVNLLKLYQVKLTECKGFYYLGEVIANE